MPYLIASIIVLAIIGWLLFSKRSYYRKIFDERHYGEIHAWLAQAITLGAVENPSTTDGSAILTSAGVALAMTRSCGPDKDEIHLSISEARGLTTRAVANRVAYLLFSSLNQNQCSAGLFFTRSGVHHLVLTLDHGSSWTIRTREEALGAMAHYEPLPFQFQHLG